MEASKQPISVRISQLNSQIVSTKIETKTNLISREGLLDALIVLYDECNSDYLKKHDQNVSSFINKQRSVLNDVKSLRVNLADFEVKSVIGRGHFGEVHVVKEKQTGDIYAMKTVKKSMCLNQKNASFEEERSIMARSNSHWLTSLQYAFQDLNHLYFIMEYHPGGDLLGLLHRQGGTIPESAAGFYVAEVILAINDLHSMGYVHRDIKPDNILLDRCGHIKLADFGSSVKLNSKGFVSEGMPVGTPDYIAPEVLQSSDNKTIKKSGYGISCDYWSVGILAYQLTVGIAPFSGQNTTGTYSKIMSYRNSLKFPPDIVLSQAYVSLVKGLLTDSGSRYNYEQIVKHSLFKNIDFDSLRDQVPPYVPKVDSVDDTSNFLDIPKKKTEPNIDNFKTKTTFSGKHLPFVGFTYTHDLHEFKQSMPFNKPIKDERFEELKKEVLHLQKELIKNQDCLQDRENLEKRFKDGCIKLESLESVRDRLERDLANSVAECGSLKRTLELERKDRITLESKALELLKSTKVKWENAEKTKVAKLNLEITQQAEKIKQLTATNLMLSEQIQHALQLENKHKTSLDNVQHLNRKSIIGLESRLDKITSDTQNKVAELQNKLSEETHQRMLLENQVAKYKSNRKTLEDKLKISEENCNSLLMKIESNQKLIRELENKAVVIDDANKIVKEEKCKNRLLEEEIIKLKSEEKVEDLKRELKIQQETSMSLRQKITNLKEEINTSTAISDRTLKEQKDLFVNQIKDLQYQLDKIIEERNKLEIQLQELKSNDQTNKLKVQTLEDLLKRLECGVSKLENDSDKDSVLKEQITRLEQQLIEIHKNSAIEKQELVQLKSKFWRVEKDLNNAEIDKRIYKRELKEAEDQIKHMSTEIESLKVQIGEKGKTCETAIIELSNLNDELINEIIRLKDVLKNCERDIEGEKKKYQNETNMALELKDRLQAKEQEIASLVKNLDVIQIEKAELIRRVEIIENEKGTLQRQFNVANKDRSVANNKLENSQAEIHNLQQNLGALREACTLLENQLIEYEKIHDAYENKQKSLNTNIEKLVTELGEAKEEIQKAKRLVNEEKSLKFAVETKYKRANEEVEGLKQELTSFKQQCEDYKEHSTHLLEQLASLEDKMAHNEVTLKTYERQISNLTSENRFLKEETTARLTNLNNIKESNYQLGQDVADHKRTISDLMENLSKLQENLTQQTNFNKEREIKSNSTIKQQTKLIDLLQSHLAEYKKKKTLSEKLFGYSKKENQPPTNVAFTYKDLELMLAKEKDANKELNDEIIKLKSASFRHEKKAPEMTKLRHNTMPLSPQTKMAHEKLTQSPALQKNELYRHHSLQRMYHNIPHRFDSKLCTKSSKCAHCSNQIVLGRNLKSCVECHIVVHPNCANYIPKTCGVPPELVKHYSNSIIKTRPTKTSENEIMEDTSNVEVEGWVKIPVRGNTGWDKHYACLTSDSLKIYAQPPQDSAMAAIQTFDLKSPNTHGMIIAEPVVSEVGTPVANNDLPFIIKVEIIPYTTCWPSKSTIILMTLSMQDKEKWLKGFYSIFQENKEKYIGDLVLSHDQSLQVNCVVDLNNDTKLLGTEGGLYSYYNDTLLHIKGPSKVHQITLLKNVKLAIMLVDANRYLITCDLSHLTRLTQSAAFTKPTLTSKVLNINNLEYFHLFQTSESFKYLKLAVATAKQLILMAYDYQHCEFKVERVLDTAQPTSCILFTEHSLIVGADKFFEIDLKSFVADEFLDASDKNLSQAVVCYKMGSFPLAIMQVSNDPIEYLLCYNEYAFFVDEFGRCSRVTDIKWSRLPLAFYFYSPYLYVVQLSSVEIYKIVSDTCNVMTNSLESLINIDSLKIDLNRAKYLGNTKRGIYVGLEQEIRYIEGKQSSIRSSLSSLTTEETASKVSEDGLESEFSFTSSMVQSLDGNLSDQETESEISEPTGLTRKVTFNTQVIDSSGF